MTLYKNSVLIICPELLQAKLVHLAGLWGESSADLDYFAGVPNYQNSLGQKFFVRHTVATEGLLENVIIAKGGTVLNSAGQPKTTNPFKRPSFDIPDAEGKYRINIPKAQEALAELVLFPGFSYEGQELKKYNIPAGKILYVLNHEAHTVLRHLELTRIQKVK